MALPEDQTAPTPPEGNAVVQIANREDVSSTVEADFMRAVLEKGSVERLPELQRNLEQVHALVRRVYDAAGVEAKISMTKSEPDRIHVELDTSVVLSPEQSAFMTTLQARYEENEHGILCHSPEAWGMIEARLKANPAKLDTLKKMEDSGGAPDVYKVEGEDFIFGDLSTKAPEGRRNVNYAQAVAQVSQMGTGSKLMSQDDYLMIGNVLGIAMDNYPEWVWLDSAHMIDLPETGVALYGRRHHGSVRVTQADAKLLNPFGAFRCSLRV